MVQTQAVWGEWQIKEFVGKSIRVFDPISLINLMKKDLKALYKNKLQYNQVDSEEASKFIRVIEICLKVGIHAGGKFPEGWC